MNRRCRLCLKKEKAEYRFAENEYLALSTASLSAGLAVTSTGAVNRSVGFASGNEKPSTASLSAGEVRVRSFVVHIDSLVGYPHLNVDEQ